MSLTIVKGMQSEIFVPITPPMVWTPVKKELKDTKHKIIFVDNSTDFCLILYYTNPVKTKEGNRII